MKTKDRNRLGALLIPALVLGIVGCADPVPRRTAFSLGDRPAAITVPASAAAQLPALREQIERQFRSAWSELNLEDRRSDIAKINRVAGTYRLQVGFNTFRALDLAHYYSQLTSGAYDLTLLPAMEAWGFEGPVPAEPPSDAECAALLELIGPRHLQFAEQGAIAILTPGSRIAPNGLPYAYGVDLALVELRRQEIPAALISWDRYTRALGKPAADSTWRQSVRHPFAPGTLGEIALDTDQALAVVGLRDRTVTIGGQIYGGILDPRTARPAQGVALVAVRGPTCIMANALAHALIVLGVEEGTHLLNEFPDCDILLIPDRQPVEAWATEGWIENFTAAAPAISFYPWERPARPVDPAAHPLDEGD